MYTRGGGDGREGEDSGRTAVPRSRWMLEGLFAVRGRCRREGGREGERGVRSRSVRAGNEGGCNTCTWHGQCIRYPTNARNSLSLSLPPSRGVSRTHRISPLPPLLGPSLPSHPPSPVRAMSPLPPPRILLPADACNSPDVKCNIRLSPLSWSPTRDLFPPLPPGSSLPSRDGSSLSFSLSLFSCAQFMHLIRLRAFIARAHGLYRLVSIMNVGETGEDGVFGGKSDNEDTPAEDWCVCEGPLDPREYSGVPCE